MNYLSVCSGIEAATVAWHPLGWKPTAFAEIEKFPSAVLAHHYPHVPNLGDMTKFKDWPDATPDVLVGGTPCQSFSVAGLRKGMADPRGNLALVYLGIADRYRPEWLLWENVPGVLSSNGGRDFGSILGGMAELGYGFAYRVLDAQYVRVDGFGRAVPQRRRRVFVVGNLGSWRRAAAVLFERESLSWDSAPRRETGERVAPTISARPTGGGGLGTDFDLDGGLITKQWPAEIAPTLNAAFGSKQGLEDQHALGGAGLFVPVGVTGSISHTLKAEGADASEDGTGRGTPIIPVHAIQAGALRENPEAGPDGVGVQADLAYTLEARSEVQAIAFDCKPSGRNGFAIGEISPTLRAMGHKDTHQNAGGQVAVATPYTLAIRGRGDTHNLEYRQDGTANAILTPNGGRAGIGVGAIAHGWAVRRLTPRECERLQGFPDGYTDVPWRNKNWTPDGLRYKALGNSMAVNVMRWIGMRIQHVSDLAAQEAIGDVT